MRPIAFLPYVNNLASLKAAAAGLVEHAQVRIIDNSLYGLKDGEVDGVLHIIRPVRPLTFTQTMNLIVREAQVCGVDWFIWAHSDIVVDPNFFKSFIEKVDEVQRSGDKWGVYFTTYDALSAVNVEAASMTGPWDEALVQYKSDVDWYHRMLALGYQKLNFGGRGVKHEPSGTIRTDPMRRWTVDNFDNSAYYARKWGGPPNSEKYPGDRPWDDKDMRFFIGETRKHPAYQELAETMKTTEGNMLEIIGDQAVIGQLRFRLTVLDWIRPRIMVETGTQKGMWALFLAMRLNSFFLATCDANHESAAVPGIIKKHFPEADVTFHHGLSHTSLPSAITVAKGRENIDLGYVDGGHNYQDCKFDLESMLDAGCRFVLVDDVNMPDVRRAMQDVVEERHLKYISNPWTDDDRRLTLIIK